MYIRSTKDSNLLPKGKIFDQPRIDIDDIDCNKDLQNLPIEIKELLTKIIEKYKLSKENLDVINELTIEKICNDDNNNLPLPIINLISEIKEKFAKKDKQICELVGRLKECEDIFNNIKN